MTLCGGMRRVRRCSRGLDLVVTWMSGSSLTVRFLKVARGTAVILPPGGGGVQFVYVECSTAFEPGGDFLAEKTGHGAAEVSAAVAFHDHRRLPGDLHQPGVRFG